MMSVRTFSVACVVGLLTAGGMSAGAQERSAGARSAGPDDNRRVRVQTDVLNAGVNPLSGPVVTNAPFSGEATTTVTQTLGDGTHIEQKTTSKLYRDSAGRVRREQTIMGLDRLSSTPPQTIITFDSVPGDTAPYILDPVAKVASRSPVKVTWTTAFGAGTQAYAIRLNVEGTTIGRELERTLNQLGSGGIRTAAGAGALPGDVQPTEEQLGTRLIEGVKAVGKRTTTVIPLGRIGNDSPIRIVDERWESPELNMIVYSRFADPRTGIVEYKLTNINRSEPRADLFAVPSDYTVRENAPGLRTGGRGPRGGRSPQ